MPDTGGHGQPRYSRADPTKVAAYLTAISDYAAMIGNRKVGTTTDRNALSFEDDTAWEGLRFRDLTDGNEYEFDDSGNPVLVAQDTGWQLSPITLGTGWSTLADPVGGTADGGVGGVRIRNGYVSHRWRAVRAGSAITADGTSATNPGNFADVNVGALDTDFAPTAVEYGKFYIVGVGEGSARVSPSGAIDITNANTAAVIASGGTLQFQFTYPLG